MANDFSADMDKTNMNKTSLNLLMAAALLVLTAPSVLARPQLDANVRAMIEEKVHDGEFPGIVIGLTDGEQNAVFGFGQAGQAAPDGKTVYEIGSITKTFTALLLAQAVASGKVGLEDAVSKVLPEYSIPEFDGKPITLLDLATQSSGLPRMPSNMDLTNLSDPYVDYGRRELKAFLAYYKLTRQPGAQYEYSNLGFGLLGTALSELEKKSYETLVAEGITKPLGMTSTGMALTSDMAAHLVPGQDAAGKPIPNWNFDAMAGAGAIRSDAEDLLRYVQAMMAGRNKKDSPFAMVQVPRRSTAIPDTRIGLAWNISVIKGKTLIWHNGKTGGYASFVGFTDDGKQGIVVLTNEARMVDSIAVETLFPEMAKSLPRVKLPAELLAQYAGRYELMPGFILTVTPSKTGLTVQATGQPPFPADVAGTDEFSISEVGARLSFARDGKGIVESVTLHQNGHDLLGRKLASK